MRRPSPRRWSSGAMPSSPAGRTPDRKSTRLNSSHLVISYAVLLDRKSTRLNSSHLVISYAVFCLKKIKMERTLGLKMERVQSNLERYIAPPRKLGFRPEPQDEDF